MCYSSHIHGFSVDKSKWKGEEIMTNMRIGLQGSNSQYTGVQAAGSRGSRKAAGESFAQALAQAKSGKMESDTSGVRFSKHALQRLQDRNIDLDSQALEKLNQTVERMSQKGSREALIYLNDVAMVVSIAKKTVVTAVDGDSAKENIFTNIDSAAIL